MRIKISMNNIEMNEILNKLIPPTYLPEGMKVMRVETSGYPVTGYEITIGNQPKKEEDE